MNEKAIVLEFEGYPTFNDVVDSSLRNKNRGNVVVNIVEDCTFQKHCKEYIWEKVQSYMRLIPEEEWPYVYSATAIAMLLRSNSDFKLN